MEKMTAGLRHYGKWVLVATIVGVLAGSMSALFLVALDGATQLRLQNEWLIWFLPVGGLAVGLLYHHWGREVEAGNNLLLEEIHQPKAQVPLRMAPLIFIGTVATHIFGGSAGREGTAVQMGGAIADQVGRWLNMEVTQRDRRLLLMCGMSAGFGSVFGVPWAGAVFGMEVLTVGRVDLRAIFECLLASFVAHWVCLGWGIHHSLYARPIYPEMTVNVLLSLVAAGAMFGCAAWVFAQMNHGVRDVARRWIAFAPLRPVAGGLIVASGLSYAGNIRFAGLGVSEIQQAMVAHLPAFDFAWKTLLTALTLGSGFKGGEVTPLLFIGAAMGNSLSAIFPVLNFSLLAAVGFVAVFAGAANTPWACTLMAMEIFGPQIGVFAFLACFVAFLSSGNSGIYGSQRLVGPSKFWFFRAPTSLTFW
jgi:H+/Cl- antiporter ClcA